MCIYILFYLESMHRHARSNTHTQIHTINYWYEEYFHWIRKYAWKQTNQTRIIKIEEERETVNWKSYALGFLYANQSHPIYQNNNKKIVDISKSLFGMLIRLFRWKREQICLSHILMQENLAIILSSIHWIDIFRRNN